MSMLKNDMKKESLVDQLRDSLALSTEMLYTSGGGVNI